nr:MAG TPA: hypothetical protein [Caudoviricetes sp.]
MIFRHCLVSDIVYPRSLGTTSLSLSTALYFRHYDLRCKYRVDL